jgi:hypothetical protein
MMIAAAIRITSPDETRVIEHAAAFARQNAQPCFVISIVPSLPYGALTDAEEEVASANLETIVREKCSPVMQEGTDVPQTLLEIARSFGISTLFVKSGATVERLLTLHPSFDVVVVSRRLAGV